jgi:hypothetical protein
MRALLILGFGPAGHEIEVRHVWRTVSRQELIAKLFDEES